MRQDETQYEIDDARVLEAIATRTFVVSALSGALVGGAMIWFALTPGAALLPCAFLVAAVSLAVLTCTSHTIPRRIDRRRYCVYVRAVDAMDAVAELRVVDALLARRAALDGFDTRAEKIQHAISTARRGDALQYVLDRAAEWREHYDELGEGERALVDTIKQLVDEHESEKGDGT